MTAFGGSRTSPGIALNRPKDGAAFERLCAELFARVLDDPDTQQHGRSGQAQRGVDIYGRDRRSGDLIGVECKKRASAGTFDAKDLEEAHRKARSFDPPLDRLIVMLSSDTDTALQRRALELSQLSGMRVEVHGWPWIEENVPDDIAIAHQLRATSGDREPATSVDQQIGVRLSQAIAVMNEGRFSEDALTLQGFSVRLGQRNWRHLEQICLGVADTTESELSVIAAALGINPRWLIEGKAQPFETEQIHPHQCEAAFARIVELDPQMIAFVRRKGTPEDHGHEEAVIVLQLDDARWRAFDCAWPVHLDVGSGGRADLISFYCLTLALLARYEHDPLRVRCVHLDDDAFWDLSAGTIHAGTALFRAREDNWALLLGALKGAPLKRETIWEDSLRAVIDTMPTLLANAQRDGPAMSRKAIRWAGTIVRGVTKQADVEDARINEMP